MVLTNANKYIEISIYIYIYIYIKVKCSRHRPDVAQRVGRGIALLFHDRGTIREGVVAARPGRTLPPGKTRYPFYRRLGGPQGLSGRAENLIPTGIRSRTVQPAVSHYTDWATGPIIYIYIRTCSELLHISANHMTIFRDVRVKYERYMHIFNVLLTVHPCIIFFKWSQLGAHYFLVYLFQLLYMFRATLGGCLVCW